MLYFRRARHSFNPHSRVGSDGTYRLSETHVKVSIHTPAWGVTALEYIPRKTSGVSIHTPAWGVTGFRVALKQKH